MVQRIAAKVPHMGETAISGTSDRNVARSATVLSKLSGAVGDSGTVQVLPGHRTKTALRLKLLSAGHS